MESSQPSPKKQLLSIWTLAWMIPLIIECGVAIYFLFISVFHYWADRWIQDDAYISFRFAKHFIEGHGLVYNIGEPVEGYTNFLWTIISAIPLGMGRDDPLPFMHGVSLGLWLASYCVLLTLGILLYNEGNWAAPLALIPLTFHWSYNMWFFSGMETPLVSFLTLLPVFCFSFDPEKHPTSLFWTSLSAIGLMLTRPDGVMLFPALALVGLGFYWRPIFVERKWVRYILMPFLPILIVYIPYTLWRVHFYGSFYPNTYYAKVAYLTYYERGWVYLKAYLDVFRFAQYVPIAVIGAIIAGRTSSGRFLWASISATAFVFLYVVRFGGDFMEWRFVTPVTGVLYPSIVIGAGVLGRQVLEIPALLASKIAGGKSLTSGNFIYRSISGGLGWIAACTVLIVFSRTTIGTTSAAKDTLVPGQETIALLRRYCDPAQYNWRSVAKLFAEVIPPEAKIATTSAGIIPFYCDRPCLDLHGLTDPVIARMPVDPNNRGRMGHEHWLQDYNEMRKRGVDIYLFWADPKAYAKSLATPSKPNMEMVSAKLPDSRYVEFLILNHSKINVEELRKDPRLVFYDEAKISLKDSIYSLKSRFSNYELIDQIDLENHESERGHDFREIIPAGAPYGHNFHTKILTYGGPLRSVVLEDDGMRLYGEATWKVRNVAAGKKLVMIVRYDHTGHSSYEIEVNGHVASNQMLFPPGAENWEEAFVEIPASDLVEGENSFKMHRLEKSPSDAEVYYFWFLQAKG
jgi:arabinofuranosyltransferase